MGKLTSMKISRADREAQRAPSAIAGDGPQYPWGLSLTLDDDALEKLGLDKLPTVGKKLTLVAEVTVASVSSNQYSAGQKKHQSVGLQITAMCLEAGDAADAADALYKE